MKRALIIFFIASTAASHFVWSQFEITGEILTEEGVSPEPLPGVHVIEKRTQNFSISDREGKYSIVVKDSTVTLVFAYLGYITRELSVDGQHEVNTSLKPFLISEKWDQKIRLYLSSGVIHVPLGGQLDVLAPVFNSSLSARTSLSYQSDLGSNTFFMGSLGVYRIRLGPRHGLDLDAYYRNIAADNDLKMNAFSLETLMGSFYLFDFILGYSHLNIKQADATDYSSKPGFVVGANVWVPRPISLEITGKVSLYKGIQEYQVALNRRFRSIQTFIRHYNIASYSELSIGVGYEFTYSFKYQRNEY